MDCSKIVSRILQIPRVWKRALDDDTTSPYVVHTLIGNFTVTNVSLPNADGDFINPSVPHFSVAAPSIPIKTDSTMAKPDIYSSISTLTYHIDNNRPEVLKTLGTSDNTKIPTQRKVLNLNTLKNAKQGVLNNPEYLSIQEQEQTSVLLLLETDLISKYWTNGNYNKFCMMLDCPLFAKIDECSGIEISIDHFTYISQTDSKGWEFVSDPTDQRPMYGLILYEDEDDDDDKYDDYNDSVIYKIFFQGKKVPTCLPLWYYVIYLHVLHKDLLEEETLTNLREYAFRRISQAEVPLELSTHPSAPKEIVPIQVALYYCTVGSTKLFGEDSESFLHEKLRKFYPVVDSMLDILYQLHGYRGIDVMFVLERAKTFEILSQLNRIPHLVDKRYFLLQKIFETSPEGFLTYRVKDPDAFQYLHLLDYNFKSVIPFNYSEKFPVDFRPFVQVAYELVFKFKLELCEKTCRPFFCVNDPEEGQISYFRLITKAFRNLELDLDGEIIIDKGNPIYKINRSWIPFDQLYIELTRRLKKFPSSEEYVEYCMNRMRVLVTDQKVYLFSPIMLKVMKYYYFLYSKLNVTIDEFIKRSTESVRIENCVRMEGVYKGSDVKGFIKHAKALIAQELICFNF